MNFVNIFLICGVCEAFMICIGVGIYLKHKADKVLKNCTDSCKGVLYDIQPIIMEESSVSGSGTVKRKYYFPVYEYEVENIKYQITTTIRHRSKAYFEGEKAVEIRYNPNNPKEAYVIGDVFSKAWIGFLLAGILCLIDIVIILIMNMLLT